MSQLRLPLQLKSTFEYILKQNWEKHVDQVLPFPLKNQIFTSHPPSHAEHEENDGFMSKRTIQLHSTIDKYSPVRQRY